MVSREYVSTYISYIHLSIGLSPCVSVSVSVFLFLFLSHLIFFVFVHVPLLLCINSHSFVQLNPSSGENDQ